MEERKPNSTAGFLVCPVCGGQRLIRCVQDNYAAVSPADKLLTLKSQPLYHEICTVCGTVVRSFVKKPEKLI